MTALGRAHNGGTAGAAAESISQTAYVREAKVVPSGSMRAALWLKPHPLYAARGEGCWVVDVDGRRVLDCADNFFSLIHGDVFPPVLDAVHDAMANGTAYGLPTESEILVAEALAARNPRMEQTRSCNSGAEAIQAAGLASLAHYSRPAVERLNGLGD